MEELPGSLGTSASLALRLGQAIFAVASLLFMCLDVEFYSYTAFCFSEYEIGLIINGAKGITWILCFLVTIMGLTIPWSLTLAVVDIYLVFFKRAPNQVSILAIVLMGDWVLSFLSLGASCSTASVTNLLLSAGGFCGLKLCTRYQQSAAMAFLSWFLLFASSLFNLWLLPSV